MKDEQAWKATKRGVPKAFQHRPLKPGTTFRNFSGQCWTIPELLFFDRDPIVFDDIRIIEGDK